MKDVLAALKNPVSNPGMLVGKAVEKAKRSMGVVTPIPILGAHADLAAEADKLGGCIARFGGSVEDLLAKYQKKIVGMFCECTAEFSLDNPCATVRRTWGPNW